MITAWRKENRKEDRWGAGPSSSTCPRLHNNNGGMCIPHSINCTPRDSALLYSKATKRTIPVESLRGYWIYRILIRFFKYRISVSPFSFQCVCMFQYAWKRRIFSFWNCRWEIFFVIGLLYFFFLFLLSRIFCEKFTVNLFCSFVCVGIEFFFL